MLNKKIKNLVAFLIAALPFQALACGEDPSKADILFSNYLTILSFLFFVSFIATLIASFIKKYKGNKKLRTYYLIFLALSIIIFIILGIFNWMTFTLCSSNPSF